MTYDEFVKKYNNRATDWDTVPINDPVQCVDLAKIYVQEVLGVKTKGKGVSAWGDARAWYENFYNIQKLHPVCFRLGNTKTFVPIKGDICVLTENNKFGHICIATGEGDTRAFYSYDQNFGGKAMKKVKHTYTSEGFLGVLRPYRTVRKDVNVRKGPSTTYPIVGEMKKGDEVKIFELDSTKRWARIGSGEWISYNYINAL